MVREKGQWLCHLHRNQTTRVGSTGRHWRARCDAWDPENFFLVKKTAGNVLFPQRWKPCQYYLWGIVNRIKIDLGFNAGKCFCKPFFQGTNLWTEQWSTCIKRHKCMPPAPKSLWSPQHKTKSWKYATLCQNKVMKFDFCASMAQCKGLGVLWGRHSQSTTSRSEKDKRG